MLKESRERRSETTSRDKLLYLNALVGGQKNAKKEKRLPGRTKRCLGSPIALTGHSVYSHYLLTLISLIQEQTVAMLQGHQDGKSLAMRGSCFAEAAWTSSTCATIFISL